MADSEPLPIGQLLRISSDRSGQGLGVERQSQDNHVLADGRGWQIIETFSDNDKSAYRGRFGPDGRWITGRPEYERCLQWLRDGRIKGVVAYHPDRIFGHPRELEDLIDLIDKTGIQIATVQTGTYDLATAPGRFMARSIAAASRYEREMKAERHKRKHLELAEAGRPSGGGLRPFGFEPDHVTLRSTEAAIVAEMARRCLAGESVRSIAADLNERGVPTVTGKTWTQATVRQIVTSARIAGLREHRPGTTARRHPSLASNRTRQVAGKAVWPAIIDRAAWEAICRIFNDPSRKTKRTARSYLLTGVLWCGREDCGARLVSRPTQAGKRAYACAKGPGFSGCGKLKIMAPDIERFIVAGLLHRATLGNLDAAVAARSSEAAPAATVLELTEVEHRLDRLAKAFGAGKIDERRWLIAHSDLEEQRDNLAAHLAAQHRTSALSVLVGPGSPREKWDGLTFDQQHAALMTAVRVTILPATPGRNWFDPERVVPEWFI